jgi:pyruvate dehydrogenase (quinone)
MSMTTADVLVERLIDWGVDTIFGLPGDGINGIMEALRTRQDEIRFIHVRHEEAAAFMACGYAKFTGRLGVCLATSGPGGIHLLNGLYDAKLDRQPVLAITGMTYHDLVHTFTQQDVELDKLFMDVAVYNNRVMGKAHVANTLDLAVRAALAYRGVGHITIPADVQDMQAEERSKRNKPHHTSDAPAQSAAIPDERSLTQAAEILNGGRKAVILAGQGALDARDQVLRVADLLGAPIVKPLLGKGVVPDESPYTTGGIGLLGTKPSQDAIEQCDTLLMVGTSFPYIEYLPTPDQARAVQIDIDPLRIGLRYPVEIGLVGDSARTLEQLLPRLRRKDDRGFLESAQKGMRDWWRRMDERGTQRDRPMKPEVVGYELNRCLRDDAIITCDSGTVATWAARQIRVRGSQRFSLSGNLATMANGFPYAIAAQLAFPERQVVAFVGDGGFSMLMAELSTCVKYQLPLKVVVIKNNVLGQIKWEQMVFLGNPQYGVELEPIDHVKLAEACGASGFSITDPAECGRIMEQALNTPGPVVIEAVVDPNEPPMPPKITRDQALKFAQSLVRGEPNRDKIALTALSDRVRELV